MVGDPLYAGKRETYGLEGQALHASDLIFTHPVTGEEIHVSCELPQHLEELFRKLRK